MLPWWLSGKESASSEEMWRFPGERNGSPLQDFCLENPMDGEAWWATVPGVAKELDTTQRLTHTELSLKGENSISLLY